MPFPDFDPVLISIGPLDLRWYALAYVAGIVLGWWYANRLARNTAIWAPGQPPATTTQVDDLVLYITLGIILGGRLGYALFYQPHLYGQLLSGPDNFALFRLWDGGMSFHGGLIGVMLAGAWWCRKHAMHWFDTLDFVAPLVPLGLGFGRIGNWIGGELWGRLTSGPFGVVFPRAPLGDYTGMPIEQLRVLHATGALDAYARYPSQLLQAFLEGLVLFLALWWFSSRPRPRYAVSGLFALLYGLFRIVAEFFRQPDPQYGYLAFGWLTMGMVLSLPLVALGLVLLWRSRTAPVLGKEGA